MQKKIRAASFAASVLFIITGLLPWRQDRLLDTTLSGWSFLVGQPTMFLVVVLFLVGSLSFVFLRHKRYGFFTIALGGASLFLLVSDMTRTLRLTQQHFAQLYQSGFVVSLVLIGILMLLAFVGVVLTGKDKG